MTPKNLDEAIETLIDFYGDVLTSPRFKDLSQFEFFIACSKDEIFSILESSWDLNNPDSVLVKYFNNFKILNENIYKIIFISTYRKLHNQNIDFENQCFIYSRFYHKSHDSILDNFIHPNDILGASSILLLAFKKEFNAEIYFNLGEPAFIEKCITGEIGWAVQNSWIYNPYKSGFFDMQNKKKPLDHFFDDNKIDGFLTRLIILFASTYRKLHGHEMKIQFQIDEYHARVNKNNDNDKT